MHCKACGKDSEQRDDTCLHCGASVTDTQVVLRLVSGTDPDDEADTDATLFDGDQTLLRPGPGPGWQRAVMSAQKTLPGHLFPVSDLPPAPPPADLIIDLSDADPSRNALAPVPGASESLPGRPDFLSGVPESFPSAGELFHSASGSPPSAAVASSRTAAPPARRLPELDQAKEPVSDLSFTGSPHAPAHDSPMDRPGAQRRWGLPMLVSVLAAVVAGIALLWWLAALQALDVGTRPASGASPASQTVAIPAEPATPPAPAATAGPAEGNKVPLSVGSAPDAAPSSDAPASNPPPLSADTAAGAAPPPPSPTPPRPRTAAIRPRADKGLNRKAGNESLGQAESAAQTAEPPKSLDDLLK